MSFRKCLTAFLILLLFSPLIPLVYAGDGDEPLKEHPWEDIKNIQPPIIHNPDLIPLFTQVNFLSVPPFNYGLFILMIKEKSQEVVKKDLSIRNVSLPRKK